MKGLLPNFISKAQTTFVKGRKIRDNILLYQELMHNYHKQMGNHKKCVIKVDLLKAYDMVNWDFLMMVLKVIGFNPNIIKWIKECVNTLSFLVCINGELYTFL